MSERALVVSLYPGGHHPQYVESLLREWHRGEYGDDLHLLTSDVAADVNPALMQLARRTAGVEVHVAETPAEFKVGYAPVYTRERTSRALARRYAERLRPDHLLFTHLDSVQVSLAADLRFSWPLAVSGIYFRPSFHYASLGAPPTMRERVRSLAKEAVLRTALRNPHLRTIFVLDRYAVDHLAPWSRHTTWTFLPEPLWIPPTHCVAPDLVSRLDPQRRRLVVFGALDERKGIRQVLEALEVLPRSEQRRLALVLAGTFVEHREDFLARLAAFETDTEVQLAVTDAYVPEGRVQPLLASCDLGLVTYLRHVGSSGQLVRAAAAGLPVLASDYGLVAATVRENALGATVDARSPDAIRAAISRWLADPSAIGFDAGKAARFAESNTSEAYAKTIFEGLWPPADPRPASDLARPPRAPGVSAE